MKLVPGGSNIAAALNLIDFSWVLHGCLSPPAQNKYVCISSFEKEDSILQYVGRIKELLGPMFSEVEME